MFQVATTSVANFPWYITLHSPCRQFYKSSVLRVIENSQSKLVTAANENIYFVKKKEARHKQKGQSAQVV